MTANQIDIQTIIDKLVEQRQSLRAAAADPAILEANRHALAYWHLEFTRALARDANAQQAAASA